MHDHNGETLTGRSPDFFGDLENLNRQNPVKWFIGYTAQIDIYRRCRAKDIGIFDPASKCDRVGAF